VPEINSNGVTDEMALGGEKLRRRSLEEKLGRKKSNSRKSPPGVRRAIHTSPPTLAVKRQDTVKREGSSSLQGTGESIFDVTMEDVLSVVPPIKLEGNHVPSTSLTKMKRIRQTFSHLPSAKDEALDTFTQVQQCAYQFDDLGESQQEDVMACECKPLKSGNLPRGSTFLTDCRRWHKPGLRRQRLHQLCYLHGVHRRRMFLRYRLSKSTVPALRIRLHRRHSHNPQGIRHPRKRRYP
jgi:hypothetical protein